MVTRSPLPTFPGAQDVGHPADFVMQLAIADVAGLRGVVAFPDDRGLVARACADAGRCNYRRALSTPILEPFDRDIAGARVRPVADLVEGLDPVDPLAMLSPESIGIADRALIHLAVFGLVDEGSAWPILQARHRFCRTFGPSTLEVDERGDHRPFHCWK